MDILRRSLITAASNVGAVISPTLSDGETGTRILLAEADLNAIRRAADQGPQTSPETTRLRHEVTLRGGMRSLALSEDAAKRLIRALVDFDSAIDRDRRVRNGTFNGPMSSREAMQWTLGRARRGLR